MAFILSGFSALKEPLFYKELCFLLQLKESFAKEVKEQSQFCCFEEDKIEGTVITDQ